MSKRAQACDKLGCFVDGEEEDFGCGRKASDFQGGIYTVHNRHVDVEENDVRL